MLVKHNNTYVFNLYSQYIMKNAGLEEIESRIKISWWNINTFRYADDTIYQLKVVSSAYLKLLIFHQALIKDLFLKKWKYRMNKLDSSLKRSKPKDYSISPDVSPIQIIRKESEIITGLNFIRILTITNVLKRCLLLGRKTMPYRERITKLHWQ